MGLFEGMLAGAGQVAGQQAQNMLNAQLSRYRATADVYKTMMNNPDIVDPTVKQEAFRRYSVLSNVNPMDKSSIQAAKGLENFGDMMDAHHNSMVNNAGGGGGGFMTGSFGAPAKSQPSLDFAAQASGTPAPQQPQYGVTGGQVGPPQEAPQMAPQAVPQPAGDTNAFAGSQMSRLPGAAPQPPVSEPQGATEHHLNNMGLGGKLGDITAEVDQLSGPDPDPPGQMFQSQAHKQWVESRKELTTSVIQQHMMLRNLQLLEGNNARPVDTWRTRRQALGDKEADQYRPGTWTDAQGTHNHEMVTLSGGRMFDGKGNELQPTTPVSFAPPHYTYDVNGNLVDVPTVDSSQQSTLKKPPVTRTTSRTQDLWGTGSSTSTTTTTGAGGGGGVAPSGPPSKQAPLNVTRTSPLAAPVAARVQRDLDPSSVAPNPDIPPDVAKDPRFIHGVDALTNRKMSLADFPEKVRPYLVAAMPAGVRPAETAGELSKLISADKAISLIQSRVKEVRAAAAPGPDGKSILDDPMNRMAIRAILVPPAGKDSSSGSMESASHGFFAHQLESGAQDFVRGHADPKVVNYVNKLRQLRDDILALRSFLGNAPMRSNAQMNVQLAQVPDDTISSYKDLDSLLTSFETTPTAAQGIQAGGRPSAPGTSTSVDSSSKQPDGVFPAGPHKGKPRYKHSDGTYDITPE